MHGNDSVFFAYFTCFVRLWLTPQPIVILTNYGFMKPKYIDALTVNFTCAGLEPAHSKGVALCQRKVTHQWLTSICTQYNCCASIPDFIWVFIYIYIYQ